MFTRTLRQRGVTLIELVMFIVIIGVALAGLLQVLSFTTKTSADPVRRKQALMIAESLLEEVRLAAFSWCDPSDPVAEKAQAVTDCAIAETFGQGSGGEPAGPRPYDNVNDYVGSAGTATAAFNAGGVLTDANGDAIDAAGYTAQVTIRPAVLNDIGATGASADTDVLRITVEVSYDGETLALDGYRTRYAPTSP
ncbi:prepilin-type N-terminal cleavage/methylation domain-containing protein [Massilia cavernae]|uniref:Type II secretion system protein n=1 Tax=Massilia cavernae TaxID=2320864 RepID=A0A418Y7D2_9BURK|nr:prepilin-type N-terminal cleavage/methylation domain-containing protein [Massilia cavernae]RJG25822.1 type II secretion system protein [Massilia cavernae]